MKLCSSVVGFITILILLSCSKPTNSPQTNPVIPPSTGISSWECTVNDIFYKGSIDTSFANFISGDTIVYCTGISSDKKANIYFRININRRSFGKSTFSTLSGLAVLAFDTSSEATYRSSFNYSSEIVYQIDTLTGSRIKASFSGAIVNDSRYPSTTVNVTGGKFSCNFGTGDSEPKLFSFRKDTILTYGYIRSASLITNTLILDCQPLDFNALTSLKLIVHTGGTIKTGTYLSANGDAGLYFFEPSYYPYYITDNLGNLSVDIKSVSGNIVEGSFSGTNSDGKLVKGGSFICRVKYYQAQPDLNDKWKFAFDENSFYHYTIYGGNILNAKLTSASGTNVLTINGESDNGESKFKMVLNSGSAFTPGIYQSGYFTNRLDSLYFTSNQKLWNGNTTYLYSENSNDTYVRIDTINSQKVTGALLGKIRVFFGSGGSTSVDIKKGSFKATF